VEKLVQDIMTCAYPEIEWVDDLTEVIKNTEGHVALVSDGNH
jgi:hypothetical protein